MIAWFIVPYKTRILGSLGTVRYCAMDDYSAQLKAVGGVWHEVEILGGKAIVKVRAPAGAITALNAIPGFVRVPLDALNESLSSMTTAQRTALRQFILDCGYTMSEVQAGLGSTLMDRTIGDVLRFLATRRASGVRAESIDVLDRLVS